MTLLGRGRKPVLVLAAIGWAWVRALAGSRSVAVVVLVSLLASPTLRGERDRAALLTIGNSFAEDAATYLPELAAAGGKTLVLGRAQPPRNSRGLRARPARKGNLSVFGKPISPGKPHP